MSIRTLFVSLFLLSVALTAQSLGQRQEGKIISTGSTDTLWVELYEHPGQILAGRFPVTRDGTFVAIADNSLLYEVRVVTSRGDRLVSEHIQFRAGHPVEIRLPKTGAEGKAPGGPISAARLAHKPTKDQRKKMREADALASAGNLPASAERLEQILQADPKWFEAWNNLGARRLTMGRHAEAAEAFRQALEIDRNSGMVHSNLGLALLFLRQSAAAEDSGHKALQLEPESMPAHYVVGMALLQQNKQVEEGLHSLRLSSKTIPRARLAVAEWHCRHNEFGACREELQSFLKTPRGPNHEAAERWVREVNHAMKSFR